VDDDKKEVTMRDIDHSFMNEEETKIKEEVEFKGLFAASFVFLVGYMILSGFIWGLFFYRGGGSNVSMGVYLIDFFACLFLSSAIVGDREDKVSQVIAGVIIYMLVDILAKTFILHPIMVKIFE